MARPAIQLPDPDIVTYPSGVQLWKGPDLNDYSDVGRNEPYDPTISRAIIFKLSQGATLENACQDLKIPRTTVNWWGMDNRRGPRDGEGFAVRYARARLWGCHAINDQCQDISDDSRNDWMLRNDPDNPGWRFNAEHVARTRLRLETRRFYLSKVAPKIYGDKLDLTIKPEGDIEGPPPALEALSDKQIDVAEKVAEMCAAVGLRIKIVGLEQVSMAGAR